MIVSVIVAVSKNNVIGKNNNLIWHLPNDMQFFKKTTTGHYVIMGRKNFESIPHRYRPLPNRENIIISRNKEYVADGCIVVESIEKAIKIAEHNKEIEAFIIGGGEIYKLALELNLVTKIYLTKVHQEFQGDTFFPCIGDDWEEISKKEYKKDDNHKYDYDFLTFKKITSFTKKETP